MKNIVILGAGFGGLKAAQTIAKKIKWARLAERYPVILIDKNEYQTYTPSLYEIATTAKENANYIALKSIATLPLTKGMGRLPINFIKAEVVSLDVLGGTLQIKSNNGDTNETIPFAYLVLALGSVTNDLNIPGVKENALYLKTFIDAVTVRDVVLKALDEKEQLEVVIGGAGSTGVELAGELQEWTSGHDAKITLVDAAPSILSSMHPRAIKKAEKRLRKLNIELILGERVVEVTGSQIALESGRKLPYRVFIWAGGIKVPDVIGHDLQCFPPAPDLRLKGGVYGIGDSVCFYNPRTGKASPAVARAAITQGRLAAQNIFEDIKCAEGLQKEPRHRTYKPHEYPYVIPIGGMWAVAKVGRLVFAGFSGWVFKMVIELFYFLSVMPFWFSLNIWL